MFLQDGVLTVGGGADWDEDENETCYQLKNGSWQISNVIETNGRITSNMVVRTEKATYVFGADEQCKEVKYLPTGSKNWHICKTKFTEPFVLGCAIEVKSRGEIWLIGGVAETIDETSKSILSFDLENHTFKKSPIELKKGRVSPTCVVTKLANCEVILVTGGQVGTNGYAYSVEIINIETGEVKLCSPMNIRRVGHGIGTLKINNQPRIAVFGGYNGKHVENTIEIFDPEALKWELVEDFKMNESRYSFGYLTF